MNSIIRDGSAFILQNGKQKIASVKYNGENHSIRIFSAERRLFFLSNVGLLQNKILLNTEYGVTIGENYPIKNHRKGVLHIGENKFLYSLDKNMLELYDRRRQPVINFRINETLDGYETAAILFTITWLYTHAELNEAIAHKASTLYAS